MVCRFIQKQKVCARQHHFEQLQPRSFTAGKLCNRFFHVFTAEKEGGKRVAYFRPCHNGIVFIPCLFKNSVFGIHHAYRLLIISTFDMRPEIIASAARAHPAGKDIQKRCFSAAVIP